MILVHGVSCDSIGRPRASRATQTTPMHQSGRREYKAACEPMRASTHQTCTRRPVSCHVVPQPACTPHRYVHTLAPHHRKEAGALLAVKKRCMPRCRGGRCDCLIGRKAPFLLRCSGFSRFLISKSKNDHKRLQAGPVSLASLDRIKRFENGQLNRCNHWCSIKKVTFDEHRCESGSNHETRVSNQVQEHQEIWSLYGGVLLLQAKRDKQENRDHIAEMSVSCTVLSIPCICRHRCQCDLFTDTSSSDIFSNS
jgi:hypothetical protein